MAEFSGNIHSVTFMDYPKNSMVEVLYKDPNHDHEGFTPCHMEVDFTQEAFRDLLEEVSLDEIEETTRANIRAERAYFNSLVEKKVSDLRSEWEDGVAVTPRDSMNGKELLELVAAKGRDKDFTFAVKIAILEDPVIVKSKDKDLKLRIRTAKTLWDLFSIYFEAKDV